MHRLSIENIITRLDKNSLISKNLNPAAVKIYRSENACTKDSRILLTHFFQILTIFQNEPRINFQRDVSENFSKNRFARTNKIQMKFNW